MRTPPARPHLIRLPHATWAKLLSIIALIYTALLSLDQLEHVGYFLVVCALVVGFNYLEYLEHELQQIKSELGQLQQHSAQNQPIQQPPDIFTETTPLIDIDSDSPPDNHSPGGNSANDTMVQDTTAPDIAAQVPATQKPPTPNHSAASDGLSILATLKNWFLGGNSIVRIASVILLIGIVLLIRFASEYWQFSLSAKMAGIALAGGALAAIGVYLAKRKFEYGVSLQGTGLGIVFLTLFSSFHFGVVSSITAAYLLLAMVLASTLYLALKQNTIILAFIAFACAFIAPFILNTHEHAIDHLMGYYAALNLAVAAVVWYKPWKILNSLALWMTFLIGGTTIWMYALPTQALQIAVWVWLLFALYLGITVRYSLLASQQVQRFNQLGWIDSSLIFATPFMAFSLYAGVADQVGISLSIVSGILALVYTGLGWTVQQRNQTLSILSQCFYGLALVFLALILPFAFDAYWSSIGWAIHGSVVLYIAWRYQLWTARLLAIGLLFASGFATLWSYAFTGESVVFASLVLASCYALASYWFISPSAQNSTFPRIAHFFIILSFLIISYTVQYGLQQLGLDWQQFGLAWTTWFLVLSGCYWLKNRQLSPQWLHFSQWLLLLNLILIGLQTGFDIFYADYNPSFSEQWHYSAIGIVGVCSSFALLHFKTAFLYRWQYQLNQLLVTISLIYALLVTQIWLSSTAQLYYSGLAVVALAALGRVFTNWRRYWQHNPSLSVVLALLLIMLNFNLSQGQAYYVPILNPADVSMLLLFIVWLYSLKPWLSSESLSQKISACAVLLIGLFVMSSILLRALQHYFGLPYWSVAAWQDNSVQMALTLLWSVSALVLTILASRKMWRELWLLGIAVLVLVIAKLLLLDLSQSQTLTRIISFIVSGLIMLMIGYFAPLPPAKVERT